MSERVPCAICSAMILLDTAERNGGLCAQCVKDPEGARFEVESEDRMKGATYGDFKNALRAAMKEALGEGLEMYGDEGIYGYVLYSSGDFVYVTDSLFTEESLREAAERALKTEHYRNDYASVEELMKYFRWMPGDAARHSEYEGIFEMATSMMGWQFEGDWLEDEAGALQSMQGLHCVILELLAELRASGVLRDDVFIGYMEGDQSIEERVAYGELFNNLEVAQRFADEQAFEIDGEVLDRERKRIRAMLKAGYEVDARLRSL